MGTQFWSLFWILLAAGVFSTIAILPYSLAINPDAAGQLKDKLAEKGSRIPPMLVIVLASTVQAGLLIAIAVFAGLLATRAIGLHLPVLEALLNGQPALPILLAGLPTALLLGVATGLVLIGLEVYYFQPRLPEPFHKIESKQPIWKRMLACFYGGIYEELLLRLFVMSGLIWLIQLVITPPAGQINLGVFWAANLIASLLFGLGHLPATVRIAPLTPVIVARALLLNGLAGLLFGWLFLRYGLELAMIAHFTMDIMIHVILPEFLPLREQTPQAVELAENQ